MRGCLKMQQERTGQAQEGEHPQLALILKALRNLEGAFFPSGQIYNGPVFQSPSRSKKRPKPSSLVRPLPYVVCMPSFLYAILSRVNHFQIWSRTTATGHTNVRTLLSELLRFTDTNTQRAFSLASMCSSASRSIVSVSPQRSICGCWSDSLAPGSALRFLLRPLSGAAEFYVCNTTRFPSQTVSQRSEAAGPVVS